MIGSSLHPKNYSKAETSLNVHLALNDVQVQMKSDFVF